MTENKLVSVCINAYNSEKYIADTIKSVCEQSYKNLQIIVVDDASTDSTADIVRSFDDPRIELYTLAHNGHISNANNETYRKVRGEYMVHIDSDDVMLPGLIEKSVDYLENHAECGAVFCQLAIIDENGDYASYDFIGNVYDVYNPAAKTQAEFVRLFFDDLNHLSHTGCAIRKSVIDEIGFHDVSICYLHDFDYWTRLILKYPIHVHDEVLAKYRMDSSGSHNSHMNEEKLRAAKAELSRIIYRMIDNCPDDMFLEAFADKLRLKGEHTHEEVELEKAFLLQEGTPLLRQNKILSIVKLSKLLNDKKYVELARDKFGFTARDFYKLEASHTLYDQSVFDTQQHKFNLQLIELNQSIAELNGALAQKEAELAQKNAEYCAAAELANARQAVIENLELNILRTNEHVNNLENAICGLNAEIEKLNSFVNHKQKLLNKTIEYRIAKLAKRIISLLRRIKHFWCLRDKNGKKYKKSVMLYGYYRMNLGDDLFFEKLITRYKDTMFLVCFSQEYRCFFEKFDNVKFYAYEDAFVQKIRRIGAKFKMGDAFEWLLLKRSSAAMHIGGSIYQQIGDWQLDYKIRSCRKQPFKPFYSISCNFGAYNADEFKQMWGSQFKKYKDVCFRDKYSYNLFSDIKSVRYAPDLLFSYKPSGDTQQIDGSVAISIFDPFATGRNFDEQVSLAYRNALLKTVSDLIIDDKKVTLLGFCTYEGDADFIVNLLNQLPEDIRNSVEVINYSFDTKDDVVNALSSAEYIIGTRLHSIILGFVMGKKVLPIAYNQKIDNILEDIDYNGPVIKMAEIGEYADNGYGKLLKQLKPFDVSSYANSDDLQFEVSDKFLK